MNDLELDVRPILRDGGEPFGAIMAAVGQLVPGQRLKLIAPFRPDPLFHVMTDRGFSNAAREIAGGEWEVLFTPVDDEREITISESAEAPENWPDPVRHIDCSELDPPEPMVRVLANLEEMAQGEVLFALLGREPIFLFPELKARGHAWVGQIDESGEAYRLMIRVGRPS